MTMASRPLVSVLINNFNYADFLAKSIDSALAQDYPAIEIVVVDDGSTDDSHAVMDRYGSKIVAVKKSNGGQASCFNAGFAACRGEIVCFLDSDDVWTPGKVSRVVEAAEADPEAGLILHYTQRVDGQGEPLGTPRPKRLKQGDQSVFIARWGGWQHPPTSGVSCRREVLEQVLPMPEEGFRVSADRYLAVVAGMFAPLAAVEHTLAFCLVHDRNLYHCEAQPEVEQLIRKKQFIERSGAMIARSLENRGAAPRFSLDSNLEYQFLRRRFGERVSLLRLLRLTLTHPGIHSRADRAKSLLKNLPRMLMPDLKDSASTGRAAPINGGMI